MNERIKITTKKKLITILHGCGVLFEIKANLFIDPSCIKNDGKLDIFVVVDNTRYLIYQYGNGYAITMLDMNKEDWGEYNYKELVK